MDVCNGDADGLCAVVQWRLQHPGPAALVTGLKHDIALLQRVQAGPGDVVLVCDISMQRNRGAMLRLLHGGAQVHYFDHHQVDSIPVHPHLNAHIDFAGTTCTSLLVNRFLGEAFPLWAAVGAFGDNLASVAEVLTAGSGLPHDKGVRLRKLGEAINYNAYGGSAQDVYILPEHLLARMERFDNPLDFLAHESIGDELDALRQKDMREAQAVPVFAHGLHYSVTILPDEPWSRRVIGSYANALAQAEPQRAHAVLLRAAGGAYQVSVRTPLDAPVGAAQFCQTYGGGGRAAAAAIDRLANAQLNGFVQAFATHQWVTPE